MKKWLLIACLVFGMPLVVHAQTGGIYNGVAAGVGPGRVLVPLPRAAVRVCTYSASPSVPCSPTAVVYTDATDLVVQPGSTYKADQAGNYTVFAAPGYYTVQVSATNYITNTQTYNIVVTGAGGGNCPGTSVNYSSLFNLSGACSGVLNSVVTPTVSATGGGISFNGVGYAQPLAPVVSFAGTGGATTYTYSYAVLFGNLQSANSAATSCTGATSPLTPSDYCVVTPPAVEGSIGCIIYRSDIGWLNADSPQGCGVAFVDNGAFPGDGSQTLGTFDYSGSLGGQKGYFGVRESFLSPFLDGQIFNSGSDQPPVMAVVKSTNQATGIGVEVQGPQAYGIDIIAASSNSSAIGIREIVQSLPGHGAEDMTLWEGSGANQNASASVGLTGIHFKQPNSTGQFGGVGTFGTVQGIVIDDTCGAWLTDPAGLNCFSIATGSGAVVFGDVMSPGAMTLANGIIKTTRFGSGFAFYCIDCDTPAFQGAPASASGDQLGAYVINLPGGLAAFGYNVSSGGGTTFQVNGVNALVQSPINVITSVTDAVGLHAIASNPSAGDVKIEITGGSYAGNAATATLASTATVATSLAGSPTQCTGTDFATGIAANGNANCATPAGGGSSPTIDTNTVANTLQTVVDFTTSTINSVGLVVTPHNPSGGKETFDITGSSFTGNAATATALAANPTDCSANQFANAIAASGNLTCAQPTFGNLSGSITIGQTPLTTRGDILTVSSGAALVRLALGANGTFPSSNGSDIVYRVLASADIPNNTANTSGSAGSLSGISPLPNGVTATTQTVGDGTTKVATNAYADRYRELASTTTTVGTTPINANSHSSVVSVTMTGLTTSMGCVLVATTDTSGVTGWGDTGGLIIRQWVTANTCNYRVINQTGSTITPSASVTFNVLPVGRQF